MCVTTLLASTYSDVHAQTDAKPRFTGLQEFNPPAAPADDQVIVIRGGNLVDVTRSRVIADAVVVVRGKKIVAAGDAATVDIPDGAKVIEAAGKTILPGLVDSHFHTATGETINSLPPLFLRHGVTTARDPGRPIDVYNVYKDDSRIAPRLFLTGPHYDQPPFAWPDNAIGIRDEKHAAEATRRFVRQGGTGVKVYYRLPLRELRATCSAAHALGIPVTAHLELVDADLAIAAGLDGIEHITSLGTVLASNEIAERFRESVYQDNNARKEGRYRLWASLTDAPSPRKQRLIELMADQGVFLSPTLATFERQAGSEGVTEYQVAGFANMLKLVGECHRGGVRVVTGSHTWSKYVPMGLAFQREMELLAKSGLSNMDVLRSSTIINAQFLGCSDRLGSLEPGKLADLVIVDGDPIEDISAMRNINRVMQNGNWIGTTE
ncbi:MAG: amidohydrolase family protein [Aureliella sp.]